MPANSLAKCRHGYDIAATDRPPTTSALATTATTARKHAPNAPARLLRSLHGGLAPVARPARNQQSVPRSLTPWPSSSPTAMDAYPPEYVQHNLPFIVLSGLGAGQELEPPAPVHKVLPGRAVTTISAETPPVTGTHAEALLQDFLSADGTNAPWNGRAPARKDLAHSFRIRAVGRVGQ
jgi:hypothetical protein